jgi:hypothetical protein
MKTKLTLTFNRWLPALLLAGLLFLMTPLLVQADENTGPLDFPAPLCMPDVYLYDPQDCLPLGAAQTLTDLAREGIHYPPRPMAYTRTPWDYGTVNYLYARVQTEGPINIYNSLESAKSWSPSRVMPDGMRVFSYSQRAESDGQVYYQFKSGEWVWGGDVSRITAPRYEGMVFHETPRDDFIFVNSIEFPGYTAPDYNAPQSGNVFRRYDILPLYGTQDDAAGTPWYRVGVNDWLPEHTVAAVMINTTPPEGVDNNRWIELNLFEQTMMVYEDGELVFATLVSTGVEPYYTQPGLFQIYERKETEDMTISVESEFYYLEDVPYTQYFDQARAFHGIYWHQFLGYVRSRGCVNLSIADARWLWEWAQDGDWVYIWDPSGMTPTDPALYTGGGP